MKSENDLTQQAINDKRVAITTSYFEKIDAGDPTVLDLMKDDVQFFFPKGGVRKGKDEWIKFGEFFGKSLKSIEHDMAGFNYIVQGDFVVVEGREKGVMADGKAWPDGKISQGLFCNVFEFDGEMIKRLHVYVDPDFASEDANRIKVLRGE